MLLQLARVQIDRHAAVDALHVEVLVVQTLRCQDADEKAGGAGVVVDADPHCPAFVQVDGVLLMEAVVRSSSAAVIGGDVEPSLDVGAGLGRAALVGGEGAVARESPLGFHHFGLRLMGEDLEQGRGAREQRGAERGGLG